MPVDKNKLKAITKAMEDLEKDGIKPISYTDTGIETFPTGIAPLEFAINKEGLPKGRIIEMFGFESSGKSILSLLIAATVQKNGGVVAIIDAENCFDPKWAEHWGLKNDESLIVIQADCGEDGLTAADRLSAAGADLVIIDSIAALAPKAIIEGEMDDNHVAVQARLISKAILKFNSMIKNTGTTILCINQVRDKIGVMFGDPTTTPGGRALKFFASLRLRISKIKSDIPKEEGLRINISCIKNKIAPPFGQSFFDLYFDGRIDQESALFDVALEKGVINKTGKTYTYMDKEFVGFENFKEEVSKDVELMKKLVTDLKSAGKVKLKVDNTADKIENKVE